MNTAGTGKKRGYCILSMLLMLAGNQLAYNGARLLNRGRFYHDLTLSADLLLPCLPWTVSIYFGCFVFWAVMYWRIAHLPRPASDRFFCANLLAKDFCFLLFVLFPTTNVRPVITGTTVWDGLMRLLYRLDAPDNLFPSIHCMVSWLCWVGVRGNREVAFPWRTAALITAVMVCLSTLTTRQHVLLDAAGGILLSEGCFYVAGHGRLREGYAALVDGILLRFARRKGGKRHDEKR